MTTVRDCRRSEELREALAAEEELTPGLAAHLAGCAACTRIAAAAGRFESSLDAAMATLVTDALPPSTAAVARTAPRASRGWSSPRILAGAIVTVALGAFAAVGVVTTGTSISNAIIHGSSGTEPNDGETVDCSFGEAAVEVLAIDDSDPAGEVTIAYCFEVLPRVPVDHDYSVSCIRAVDGLPIPGTGSDAGYLGACTRVEVGTRPMDAPATGTEDVVPSAPFASWDEARRATAWPVLRPRWLPAGYDLATLQGFASSTDPETNESLVATYLRHGVPLSVEQFAIADPDAFRVELNVKGNGLKGVTTGRTTVDGHAAFWADGVEIMTVTGPGSDVDTLLLTWSDGRVGYRITGRDLELDHLRRIATSLDEG